MSNLSEGFIEINEDQAIKTNGGVGVVPIIGLVIAAYTAIYGLGYAMGQNAGYSTRNKKRKR